MSLLRRCVSIAVSQRPSNALNALSYASATLIALSVLSQYLIQGRTDPIKCNALLTSGSWPPVDDLADTHQPFDRWEPTGCRMRAYAREDVWECLSKRRLVFIGDSITRQLFFAAGKRLDHVKTDEKAREVLAQGPDAVRQDESLLVEGGVRLDFRWDPWLNSTVLFEELASYRGEPPGELGGGAEDDPPAIIVLGAPGLWAAREGGDAALDVFKENIEAIRPHLDMPLAAKHRRGLDDATVSDQIFLMPVQVPDYGRLSEEWVLALSPYTIQQMNSHLRQLPARERSRVLQVYNEMTGQAPEAFTHTGLYVNDPTAERWLDIVLNARCNAALASKGHRNNLTCCVCYPALGLTQIIIMMAGALSLSLAEAQRMGFDHPVLAKLRDAQLLPAMTCISAAATYSFVADRTHVFAKTEKHFSSVSLGLLVVLLLGSSVLSAGFARHSNPDLSDKSSRSNSLDEGYFPRHVSHEWAGSMQCILLLFALQDTSESFFIYTTTRLFISALVFLSVYGHATYFLRTRDYSLRRVLLVLLRINLLPFVLDLMMRNHWTLYYWPRLISFWFLLTFVLLKAGSRRNHDSRFILFKVAGLAIIISLVSPSVTPNINPAVNNASELWQHITLDRLMPAVAVLAAAITHRLQTIEHQLAHPAPLAPAASSDPLDKVVSAILGPSTSASTTTTIRFMGFCLSIFGLSIYALSIRYAKDKASYNAHHTYLSCVAVVSVAVLRNCLPTLRKMRLRLPAAIGSFSMSTYMLCHHILLSGDGTGLLRTGLWKQGAPLALGWHFETMLLVVVLLWTSHNVQKAVHTICEVLFKPEGERENGSSAVQDQDVVLDDFWDSARRVAGEMLVVGPGRFNN